jgi:hypothetical protein
MRYFLLALLLTLSPMQMSHADDRSVSAIALVGKWSGSETLPNGQTLSAILELTPNMRFNGTAAVQGSLIWEYSGTWELQGNQLVWHYERSSLILPDSAKTDVDDVVSVDAAKLVLMSHISGKQREFTRDK